MIEREKSAIVEGIYEAALDAEQWLGVLARIADHCEVENASLVAVDNQLPFASVIAPRADMGLIQAFGEYWGQRDPTADIAARYPAGTVMTMEEIGRERFLESDYYNEYWRKLGYGVERMSVNLVASRRGFVNIGLQTYAQRDAFSPQMRDRYMALVPHLMRAVDISRKLSRLAVAELVAENGVRTDDAGIIVVNRAERIIHADDRAIDTIEAGTAIRADGGTVTLTDDVARTALRAAIVACAGNAADNSIAGSIRCRREGSLMPLMIDVLRFRPGTSPIIPIGPSDPVPVAILLIHDPDLARRDRLARLQQRFGLTQTEAALAFEMLQGDGREAAAARCGISVNTARTHLMRIFDKVGVTRQAELVRVLLDS